MFRENKLLKGSAWVWREWSATQLISPFNLPQPGKAIFNVWTNFTLTMPVPGSHTNQNPSFIMVD